MKRNSLPPITLDIKSAVKNRLEHIMLEKKRKEKKKKQESADPNLRIEKHFFL